jgi:hypothetical protein
LVRACAHRRPGGRIVRGKLRRCNGRAAASPAHVTTRIRTV